MTNITSILLQKPVSFVQTIVCYAVHKSYVLSVHKITWSEMMAAVFIQSAKKANTLIHKKNSALIVMILANPVRQMVQSVKHALKDFHLVITICLSCGDR